MVIQYKRLVLNGAHKQRMGEGHSVRMKGFDIWHWFFYDPCT